jgi:hypothetical protein
LGICRWSLPKPFINATQPFGIDQTLGWYLSPADFLPMLNDAAGKRGGASGDAATGRESSTMTKLSGRKTSYKAQHSLSQVEEGNWPTEAKKSTHSRLRC